MSLLLIALLIVFVFCVGLIVGAYSHKWLQRETGAPSNIRSTADADAAFKNAASSAAHAAVDMAHGEAKAAIAKLV